MLAAFSTQKSAAMCFLLIMAPVVAATGRSQWFVAKAASREAVRITANSDLNSAAANLPHHETPVSDALELTIKASFEDRRSVEPDEQIELLLSRPLKESEERFGIFIGTTDVSTLFKREKLRLRYNAKLWPLPLGESAVTVYIVSKDDEWKEITRFTLVVSQKKTTSDDADLAARFVKSRFSLPFLQAVVGRSFGAEEGIKADAGETPALPAQEEPPSQPASKKRKLKWVPSLTLELKSQPAQSTFPDSDRPARATFTDLTMQASLKNDATYGGFSSQSSFDFAGSSFIEDALRFGTLGNKAPRVDLSSFLMQFQTGPVKYQVGHFSFGTQRHLINSLSSRGIMITVPFLKRFDFSAAAMNGTQLVGYSNFVGLDERRHKMLSGTFGLELFPKRPGGLRLEAGLLSASFQPISGENRGVITDAQRSRGLSLRLIANDKTGRFHFEGGFTRSFFINPSDSTLTQGQNIVPLPGLSRNAHYLEISYQMLKDFSLTKTRKANLTVAFQEESVAPLFRSLGASTEADKIRYEISVNGSIDEITGQFSYVNFHTNLALIPSILRTLNGKMSLSLAAPAKALLGKTKDSPWLPVLRYSFTRVHAFGAAIPVNGGFETDLGPIPNVVDTYQTFSADWQIKKFTIGYNVDHSFQDNRQTEREREDQAVLVNTGKVVMALTSKLNLNVDLKAESSANKETGGIDRTFRIGPGCEWRLTKSMGLSANFSNTIAGDAANTTRNRNTQFDASWTYRFGAGKEGFKKVAGQFFIRYSNQYSNSLISDSLRKNQTFTANLSFTFF